MEATKARQKSQSVLSQYLREIGATPLLTAGEEQDLARRIQQHRDEEARRTLLQANLRLVVNVAKKYTPAYDPETLMDLIQEGNVGLMRAVDRFQPERQTRFSTYAVYWIKQAILRALKSRRLVRLPENVVDRVLAMQRARQSLYQMLGRDPTSEEVAKEMGLVAGAVRRLEESAADVVSLEQAVRAGESDEETQLRELLEDVDAPQPDQLARLELLRRLLREEVSTLPEREKRIVEMRFGLVNGRPRTLEDIGQHFGISRERVRQLQNTALSRLRRRRRVVRAHR